MALVLFFVENRPEVFDASAEECDEVDKFETYPEEHLYGKKSPSSRISTLFTCSVLNSEEHKTVV